MRGLVLVRLLMALTAVGFGLLSLCFADFGPIWRSLPGSWPWRQVWLDGSAALILAAACALLLSRTVLIGMALILFYDASWAAMALPAVLRQPLGFGSWYGWCEALTSLAGAWVLGVRMRWPDDRQRPDLIGHSVRIAQILFGLTCGYYGWSHFLYAGFTASMVPAWLPEPNLLARLTGIAHLAAGTLIACRIAARLAACLEAGMMSLFGLLVWVPSIFSQPPPPWAGSVENQWSELVITTSLTAAAWAIALSLAGNPRPGNILRESR